MKTLRDFNFKEKRVLVRNDFNVPLDEKGNILNDFRIKKSIPTIEYLREKGAKVILISHLGRPDLKSPDLDREKYSLKKVSSKLEELMDHKIKFLDKCIGEKVKKEIENMKPGEIVLLENLRLYREERENDENFSKELSNLGEIYINDAFAACHRGHASVVGIPKYLPSGAGFLLEEEIKVLTQILKDPKRPLTVIIGGSKIGDKPGMAERFSKITDFLLVGVLIAKEVKEENLKDSSKYFPPIDSKESFDIGEKTIEIFKEKIKSSKTVFWAGPLGKIEETVYQEGSKEIARAITESGAFSIVGGGDTIDFLDEIGLLKKFNHVSTGGGAMLEFLSGKKLPGIGVLE
ncbi:phosphoglycerate kinase [Patescibacteria group bacterium]